MWLPSPSPSCTKRSNLDKLGLDHLDLYLIHWPAPATGLYPKSVTLQRIRENLDVFGFDLTADELSVIDGLERDGRTGPHPAEFYG